jgi:hypothetical protein|tara:strand:+ start:1054 stop:1887 length:834 start_codon:yes stop_codon:yes gene_type:complete
MANTTSINSELFQNLLVQSQIALYENSVARSVATVFDYPAGAGKVVSVPVWAGMSSSKPGEGTAPSASDANTTSVSIALAEHVVYNQVTDFLRDSASEDVISTLANQSGMALAEGLDAELIALFATVTQSLGAAGTDNTVNDLMKASAMIRANKHQGPLFAILNPKQAYGVKAALTATNNYQNSSSVADAVMSNYYVGTIAGITVLEHAGVEIDVNDDAIGCVFAPQAFGLAQRGGINMETDRQAKERATDVVMTAVAGTAIIRPELAVKIVGDAAL